MSSLTLLKSAVAVFVLALASHVFAQARDFHVPGGALKTALDAYVKQAGVQLVYKEVDVKNRKTKGVSGALSAEEALKRILAGTQLMVHRDPSGAIAIVAESSGASSQNSLAADVRVARGGNEMAAMQEVDPSPSEGEGRGEVSKKSTFSEEDFESTKGIPEILVKGSRSLNTGIQRTEEDPQPYVVFGKEEIRRSQATSVGEFLKARLPMNTLYGSNDQTTGSSGIASNVNLRGLGPDQTLILVDGRRMPARASAGAPTQPNINGIPVSAIERIEVLPSTAGGIYGGSATGGVINIILRRDFRGFEASATYTNSFDTDVGGVRLDANAGFSLEGGRTQVMIAATRSQANNLLIGDRDFSARAVALQRKNNPANFETLTTPPLGATANIRGVGGALLELKPEFGGAALGAAFTHLPLGYAGPSSDNGAALVANAGQYNLDLPAGMQGMERGLWTGPSTESASLNARRTFGARVEAFLDVSRFGNLGTSFGAFVPETVANLPANAPNNPFRQAIAVSFPTPGLSFGNRSESIVTRATGGFIARLPHDWAGEVSYAWSRSRYWSRSVATAVDSIGSCVLGRGVAANVILGAPGPVTPCAAGDSRPALNVLREGNTYPIDFTPYLLPTPTSFRGPDTTLMKDATLRLSGPVVNMPGGPLNLSVLIASRKESIEDSLHQSMNTARVTRYSFYPERSQDADSYYLEVRGPLVSPNNARLLVRELEFQASVRRDAYKTRSVPSSAFSLPSPDSPFPTLTYTTGELDSTDYTLGLRYAPVEDLALRASFGTGFLPPSVLQIVPTERSAAFNLGSDPKRGGTPMYVGTPYTWITGGDPLVQPERSDSGSVGVVFTPRFAPGFRLSIDYTRIEKVDEIQTPASQFMLDNEDKFPGRIVRGENLAGDPQGWAGPIVSFNAATINIAKTSVEAYDIQANYTLRTERLGEFRGYAIGTMQPHYRNQLQQTAPVLDRVGFTSGPLKWRGNFGVDWSKGPLTVSWNAQYYDAYLSYSIGSGSTAAAVAASTLANRNTALLNQGSAFIPSQTYHDIIGTYRFDDIAGFAGGILDNSEISLGIQNLLNTSPPILASTTTSAAGYSLYGDPRLRRYTVSFRRSFGN